MADNQVKQEVIQESLKENEIEKKEGTQIKKEGTQIKKEGTQIKKEENTNEDMDNENKTTVRSEKLKTEETSHDSEDDEDDNLPLVELQKKLIKKKKVEEEPASDSDDNIPISELLEKNKKLIDKKKSSPSTDNAPRKRKRSSTTTEKKKLSSSSSVPATPSQTSASKGTSFEQLAYDTTKGQLIQTLLRRWWYAITWPDPVDVIEPPKNYVSLDGFPGVYICVQGDQMGQLFDNRNKETCPCFRNLCQKSARELMDLLVKAFTEQKRQLIEVEGEGTDLEADIDRELNALKNINLSKADKDFEKFVRQTKK